MNSVVLIGRLTADPQTHAGEQHESATFRLAVPRPGSDGAEFIDIVTFNKLAATCGEWLTKGREVAVVGKLRLNEWTGRDGEKRSRIRVVADAVQFLGAPTKKTAEPSDDDEMPADKPALGAYRRRKAS
jgi:single-strand DNA-binding protein